MRAKRVMPSKKIKVILHRVDPTKIGGPNVCVERLYNNRLLNEFIEFDHLDQHLLPNGGFSIRLVCLLRRMIKQRIDVNKSNIIHIVGLQNSGFHVALAAIGLRCKLVVTTHGFTKQLIEYDGLSFKRFVLHNLFEPLTLLFVNKVHCVSEFAYGQRIVQWFAKSKSKVIYNLPAPQASSDCGGYQIANLKNDFVILTVARVELSKGFDRLVEVIRRFKGKKVKFLIVGDGSYLPHFKEQVLKYGLEDIVIATGRLNEITSLYRRSDLFLLPSYHESFGNVFVEALQYGTPCIGTDVGGIREIISHGKNGFLVDGGDIDSISEKINVLIADPKLKLEMSKASYDIFKSKFEESKLANDYLRLYESI